MKTLYVGFSKPVKTSLLSNIIMWGQKTPFSHVYIRFTSDFLERTFIYQASGLVVNFENIDTFKSNSQTVKEFELIVEDLAYKSILQFAIDNSGKPYSCKQLLGMSIRTLAAMIGIKMANPLKDQKDAFICSEIGAYIVNIAKDTDVGDEDEFSPKDLYDILSKTSV